MMGLESAFRACPCGSGKTYEACCGRFISGAEEPSEAEVLMRSRYTAYVTGAGAYLAATLHPAYRTAEDTAARLAQAGQTEWLKLEVLETASNAKEAEVVFKAYYRTANGIAVHAEQSRFLKEQGRWFYTDGKVQHAEVGRNETCPCGSGKKYKRCCFRPSA